MLIEDVFRQLLRDELSAAFEPLSRRISELEHMLEGKAGKWLTIRQCAAHAGVCERTVRSWIQQGLPASHRGRAVRIRAEDLESWMREADAAKAKVPQEAVDAKVLEIVSRIKRR